MEVIYHGITRIHHFAVGLAYFDSSIVRREITYRAPHLISQIAHTQKILVGTVGDDISVLIVFKEEEIQRIIHHHLEQAEFAFATE